MEDKLNVFFGYQNHKLIDYYSNVKLFQNK